MFNSFISIRTNTSDTTIVNQTNQKSRQSDVLRHFFASISISDDVTNDETIEHDSSKNEIENIEMFDNENSQWNNSFAYFDIVNEKQTIDHDTFSDFDNFDDIDQTWNDDHVDSDNEKAKEFEIELFEKIHHWVKALESVKKIDMITLSNRIIIKKLEINIDIELHLIMFIREIQFIYETISSITNKSIDMNVAKHNFRTQLKILKTSIVEFAILSVVEHDNLSDLLARDMYARVISVMIFMLKTALRCRIERYFASDDFDILKKMIRIQKLIFRFDVQARNWNTTSSLKRFVKKKRIQFSIRYFKNNHFERKLKSRRMKNRKMLISRQFARSHERLKKQRKQKARKRKLKIVARKQKKLQILQKSKQKSDRQKKTEKQRQRQVFRSITMKSEKQTRQNLLFRDRSFSHKRNRF